MDYRTKTGVIEFNGYCYISPEDFPIEKILTVYEASYDFQKRKIRHSLNIRITSKEELEDTSEYSDDPEEGGSICFFPTNRTRLHFDLLPMPLPPPVTNLSEIPECDSRVAEIEIRPIYSNSTDVEVGSVIDL